MQNQSSDNRSKEFLSKKLSCFSDVLSVIAHGPAPGPVPVPGPSDEKLDFDDDTIKGEKNICQFFYYLIQY